MTAAPPLRVVIDTNVIFEGLTRQGGACGLIIDSWQAGLLRACVSTALAYEYADVPGRKLSAQRWQQLQPVLGGLLSRAEYVPIFYSWRPSSPDPGDELVIDCAMNAGVPIVTMNTRDFQAARLSLGLAVLKPVALVAILAGENQGDGTDESG
ncbi:MAG: PIN domain-containing protein [Blastocatellia bacterium]